MSSPGGPVSADEQLVEQARRHGFVVSAKQLASWRRAGLLPEHTKRALGRGRGSASVPDDKAFGLVVALARLARRGARPSHLALVLFGEGHPVPEGTVRDGFGKAVRGLGAGLGEQGPEEEEDEEEWAERVADEVVASGQRVRLVPARVRRIDEGIARYIRDREVVWPPPELADLDANPEPPSLSSGEVTTAAVTTVLRGGAAVTPQGIGDVLRAVQPSGWGNPAASLAEYTVDDVPDAAQEVFLPDGGMSTIPDGDVRGALLSLVKTAPLEDLREAWEVSGTTREWALDLCARVEAELEAGELGDAALAWLMGRAFVSGLVLMAQVGDRHWSPTDRALDSLILLMMRRSLRDLDGKVPDCQWELLESPAVLPAPLIRFLQPRHVSGIQ
ncbi:hypothetical protein GA0115237_1022101 [Streptomyces sp. ScaeMP-6W]|uniref:hypothetical protein n=1 Tax=unclassified Streptomyces TaxID=2593676 RepID=UPI00081EB55B|nr:hypothetical protein [Streptomyces sp. ScaeMP-6W]SCD47233.1 hypothetical protein GA0115237_1022101 [Streptomyces sp. ScaeMP-6W]